MNSTYFIAHDSFTRFHGILNDEKVNFHIIIVDVNSVDFFVSPQRRNRGYVPDMLMEYGLDFAINGDGFFGPKIAGYAISEGKPYGREGHEKTLYISGNNIFYETRPRSSKLRWNAISYPNDLVVNGDYAKITRKDIDPRSAIGYNKDQTEFIFLVIDGKETYNVFRTGATFTETAEILLDYGVWSGKLLDGGGSTTLVMREHDKPIILNVPCGEDKPLNFDGSLRYPGYNLRRVANILGARIKESEKCYIK